MKNIKFYFVAMLMLGAVACKKNGNSPNSGANVSTDDAATMVAGSLSLNSNGIANVSDDATVTASSLTALHFECGVTKTDSLTRTNTNASSKTFDYKLKYSYTLNCNSNSVPDNLVGDLSYSGSFSGPHLSSTNSGSANLKIAGFSPTSNVFVLNGEYKRTGSFTLKGDTTKTGNSNIDIVLTNLTVNKADHSIAGGSATITVTGDLPNKGNFTFTGNLTFKGDGTATFTLNGGAYTVNLATGAITKNK